MRSRVVVASLAAVIAAFAVASCSEGGTGIGTAPPPPPACPAEPPAAGTPCAALQMCPYEGTCPAFGGTCYAFCPGGTDPTWEIVTAGDAGTFADAPPSDAPPSDALEDATDADDDALADAEPAETEPPADTEPPPDTEAPVDDAAIED